MWHFKESEEDDQNIGMALASFIFLPSKISKLKYKGLFFGCKANSE
jgi:hypothetical protein